MFVILSISTFLVFSAVNAIEIEGRRVQVLAHCDSTVKLRCVEHLSVVKNSAYWLKQDHKSTHTVISVGNIVTWASSVEPKYILKIANNKTTTRTTLIISKLEARDAGSYVCKRPLQGLNSEQLVVYELQVRPTLTATYQILRKTSKYGQTVQLRIKLICFIFCGPTNLENISDSAVVYWILSGSTLGESGPTYRTGRMSRSNPQPNQYVFYIPRKRNQHFTFQCTMGKYQSNIVEVGLLNVSLRRFGQFCILKFFTFTIVLVATVHVQCK